MGSLSDAAYRLIRGVSALLHWIEPTIAISLFAFLFFLPVFLCFVVESAAFLALPRIAFEIGVIGRRTPIMDQPGGFVTRHRLARLLSTFIINHRWR
jgi:hypothetical protein